MVDLEPRGVPWSGLAPPGVAGLVVGDVPDHPAEPLPGVVIVQYIRCGKARCNCRSGTPHGPYYYRVWRGEGRGVNKVYVRKSDLAQVQRQCESYRALSTELRAIKATVKVLAARLRQQIRRFHRLRRRGLDGDEERPVRPRRQRPGRRAGLPGRNYEVVGSNGIAGVYEADGGRFSVRQEHDGARDGTRDGARAG